MFCYKVYQAELYIFSETENQIPACPPSPDAAEKPKLSYAQLIAEAADYPDEPDVPECDWGIVSIIATLDARQPPMPPITQMRNALGRAEGGSGVPVDRAKYEEAVAFWDAQAAIRKKPAA